MLFVGDILQLPPVNGNPVFEKIAQKSLVSRLGCTTAVNIWQESVAYNELTINERQKKDPEYSSILNNVRLGISSDEVIDVPIARKFHQLKESGESPVCLFPTRKACDDFNDAMLSQMTSEIHELLCTDEIDETATTSKWNKKAADRLERLNRDCNMTAGLQAKLKTSCRCQGHATS